MSDRIAKQSPSPLSLSSCSFSFCFCSCRLATSSCRELNLYLCIHELLGSPRLSYDLQAILYRVYTRRARHKFSLLSVFAAVSMLFSFVRCAAKTNFQIFSLRYSKLS